MKATATEGEHKSLPGLKCVTVIINMVCENCEGNSGKLLSSAEHIYLGVGGHRKSIIIGSSSLLQQNETRARLTGWIASSSSGIIINTIFPNLRCTGKS